MTVENIVRLADALNAQLAHNAPFYANVWTNEPNTIAVVASISGIIELIQSDDARTLYYATRHLLRGANRFCSPGEVSR